jgi:hypothetical protein
MIEPSSSRVARVLIPVLLFVYTLAIRTWRISERFWMHYDQIRDWGIALGPFSELPLLGPVTHLGGSPPGPVPYWVLWFIRVTIGPWFDNLPHAGGIGQALLASVADVLLFAGIRRRTGSTPLAVAIVLLVASAPYDLSLSATVWPPMLAVTFAKAATAMVLLGWADGPWWRATATAVVAWSAVQSHVPGTFVAATVLLYLVVQPLRTRAWRASLGRVLLVGAVVAVMQIPWAVYWMRQPPGTTGTPVGASLLSIARGDAQPRAGTSAVVLTRAFSSIHGSPWVVPWLGWFLAACAVVVIVRLRRDTAAVAMSAGSLAMGWIGYALWTGGYHEYYFFSLMPAAVLTVGLALTSLGPPRMRRATAWALVALAVIVQPARLRQSSAIHWMPEYRPLLRASRVMAARHEPLRRIDARFIAPTSSSTFLYEILGGRLSPDSPWIAIVNPDGSVRYERSDAASR